MWQQTYALIRPARRRAARLAAAAAFAAGQRHMSGAPAGSGSGSGSGDGRIPLAFPTVCIWGANTGVGKTLVSAGLARAAAAQQVRLVRCAQAACVGGRQLCGGDAAFLGQRWLSAGSRWVCVCAI